MTTTYKPAPAGKKTAAHKVGEALAPYDAGSDFAQSMADAFARLIGANVVGGKASGGAKLFRSYAGGARLDTDVAASVARQGLKAQAVEDWLLVAKLPKKGFYDGLRLSPSTLSRKGKDQMLDAAVTERLVRQSELMVKAAEVFGEGAATWMMKGHPLLGGATPIIAATNEYGGTKVREILNAIEHGGVV